MLALSDRTIDWEHQRVRFPDGRSLPLTTRERELMAFLADRPNEPVSRDTLLHEVWKVRALNTRAVDVTVSRLRQKLEAAPERPVHLLSVQHVGYKFVPGSALAPPVPAPHGVLPVPPGPLIGRAPQLLAVRSAWDTGSRLVTLVGTAGAGKSRVALELARGAADQGVDVRWVPVGECRIPAALATAVATVLGAHVSEDEDQLAEAVGEVLRRHGPCLLFLDGFEALAGSASVVARWLDTAPDLRVVVASRVRLRVVDEHVVEVGPLTLDEARSLFFARIAEAGVDPVSEGSADALLESLECLPLALELAAPRAGTLTWDEIRTRLAELEAPGEGRSLRAMLDHSFGLLRPPEQRALGWCATFAGGFGLDAAEAVLTEMGESWPIDLLEALCDASLVRLDLSAAEPRYHLYDAVREHASERLRASGEALAAEAAHARYYVTHGAVVSDAVERHGGLVKLRELALEIDNLLAAYRRRLPHDLDTAVRVVVVLEPLLASRGPIALLETLTDEVLCDPRLVDPGTTAELLCIRTEVARVRGQPERLAVTTRQAAALAVPGSEAEVRAAVAVALLEQNTGDLGAARVTADRALRLAAAGGYRNFEAVMSGILGGWDASAGDLAAGLQGLRRAVRIAEELGNERRMAVDRTNTAAVLRELGRLEEAVREVEVAARVHREWGNRRRLGFSLQLLGMLRAEQGQVVEGIAAATEASALLRSEGYPLAEAMGVQEVAVLRWMAGSTPADAALAFEDAAGRFRALGQSGWEGGCFAWQAAALAVHGDLVGAERAFAQADGRVRAPGDRAFLARVRRLLDARATGDPLCLDEEPSGGSQLRLLIRVLRGQPC